MTRRPGQLTRDLAGLQQPAGVVHFASSDNASLWAASSTARSKAACARPGGTHDVKVTAPTGLRC
jgi:hypothetical protein